MAKYCIKALFLELKENYKINLRIRFFVVEIYTLIIEKYLII